MNTIRNLFFVTVLVGVSFTSFAQTNLQVTVKGIKGTKGNIRIGLFNDEENFLKSAWKGQVIKAIDGTITVTFENLPKGVYAVSVIHDENENSELDSGFMGIPKEGFGFSKDAMGMFGPPKFKDASLEVKENTTVSLTLKYM
jgi:uncharacterized protein (DUF2141 family)